MNWSIEEYKLERTFTLEDFKTALAFVNKIGEIAEREDHHPTIKMHSYKKVTVGLTTSEQGNIVTEIDYKVAKLIDDLMKNPLTS